MFPPSARTGHSLIHIDKYLEDSLLLNKTNIRRGLALSFTETAASICALFLANTS